MRKSGVNTLRLECSESQKLDIVQGYEKYGDKQLRSQRIDVMLWFKNGRRMTLNNIFV